MDRLSLTLIGSLRTYCRFRSLKLINKRLYVKGSSYRWEPPGLKTEPDIPEYKEVNIKLFGYDFPVLENFENYAKTAATKLDIDSTSWTVPPVKMDVNTLQFKKEKVVETFRLFEYQRIVQVQNVPSMKLPLLLEILKVNCPAGVKIEVAKHSEEDIEFLYIPNYDQIKYEKELKELDERKKWI